MSDEIAKVKTDIFFVFDKEGRVLLKRGIDGNLTHPNGKDEITNAGVKIDNPNLLGRIDVKRDDFDEECLVHVVNVDGGQLNSSTLEWADTKNGSKEKIQYETGVLVTFAKKGDPFEGTMTYEGDVFKKLEIEVSEPNIETAKI